MQLCLFSTVVHLSVMLKDVSSAANGCIVIYTALLQASTLQNIGGFFGATV